MKKLLITGIALFICAISLTLFDLNFTTEAKAKTSNTASVTETQPYKLVFIAFNPDTRNFALYTADYDGANKQLIPVKGLPQGANIDAEYLAISPDHKTIYFASTVKKNGINTFHQYTCNLDGSNLHTILDDTIANLLTY